MPGRTRVNATSAVMPLGAVHGGGVAELDVLADVAGRQPHRVVTVAAVGEVGGVCWSGRGGPRRGTRPGGWR